MLSTENVRNCNKYLCLVFYISYLSPNNAKELHKVTLLLERFVVWD
ncbi:hypothetical protein [uncultured Gammaproteobacteria bacterium]|nr:hypothetical protein [uncultured Gammaproteobacteria bacterium]